MRWIGCAAVWEAGRAVCGERHLQQTQAYVVTATEDDGVGRGDIHTYAIGLDPKGVDGNIHTNGLGIRGSPECWPTLHLSSSAPLSRTELLRSSVLKYGAG